MKTLISLSIVLLSFSLNAQSHKKAPVNKDRVLSRTIDAFDFDLENKIADFLAIEGVHKRYIKRGYGYAIIYYTVGSEHKEHIYRYEPNYGDVCAVCMKSKSK